MNVHIPVLLNEVIEALKPKEGEVVLDATLGGGGHSESICALIGESGRLIGLDADSEAIERVEERLKRASCQKTLIQNNFRNLDEVLKQLKLPQVDKMLFDLGISSNQLDFGTGFSFQRDDPLQMTFNPKPSKDTLTAEEIINTWDEDNIADILFYYSDEGFAKRIAKNIVLSRKKKPIKTTSQLVEVIKESVPVWYQKKKIHFATKTFQALRIAVNDEMVALKEGLEKGFDHLKPGGRMAVITFHSLEDRIVKNFFREKKQDGLGLLLSKKPISPTEEERKNNRRARSAKLRSIEKK